MKKLLISLLSIILILSIGFTVAGCKKDDGPDVEPEPTAASLSTTDLDILIGQSQTLTVLNAEEGSVWIWTTSNVNIAQVSQSGMVTGVSEGIAYITAKCGDESLSCRVSVTETPVGVPVLILDKSTSTIARGNDLTITPIIKIGHDIADMTDIIVNWESTDTSKATVDDTGIVTAIDVGKVTIKASCEYEGATLTNECELTVVKAVYYEIHVGGEKAPEWLVLTDDGYPDEAALSIGASVTEIDFQTGNAQVISTGITWESSNDAIAAASTTGIITAGTAGEASITATVDGLSATVYVRTIRGLFAEKSVSFGQTVNAETEFVALINQYGLAIDSISVKSDDGTDVTDGISGNSFTAPSIGNYYIRVVLQAQNSSYSFPVTMKVTVVKASLTLFEGFESGLVPSWISCIITTDITVSEDAYGVTEGDKCLKVGLIAIQTHTYIEINSSFLEKFDVYDGLTFDIIVQGEKAHSISSTPEAFAPQWLLPAGTLFSPVITRAKIQACITTGYLRIHVPNGNPYDENISIYLDNVRGVLNDKHIANDGSVALSDFGRAVTEYGMTLKTITVKDEEGALVTEGVDSADPAALFTPEAAGIYTITVVLEKAGIKDLELTLKIDADGITPPGLTLIESFENGMPDWLVVGYGLGGMEIGPSANTNQAYSATHGEKYHFSWRWSQSGCLIIKNSFFTGLSEYDAVSFDILIHAAVRPGGILLLKDHSGGDWTRILWNGNTTDPQIPLGQWTTITLTKEQIASIIADGVDLDLHINKVAGDSARCDVYLDNFVGIRN